MKKTLRIKSFMLSFEGDAELGASLVAALASTLGPQTYVRQIIPETLPDGVIPPRASRPRKKRANRRP